MIGLLSLLTVWANDGGEKIVREDTRSALNHVWDGHAIHVASARNETAAFVLVLAAPKATVTRVDVKLRMKKVDSELFYTRYLAIEGLNRFNYEPENAPARFRGTTWNARPDHDKHYPEIAVPIALHPAFTIAKGESESIWIDLHVPKKLAAGVYHGAVEIKAGEMKQSIPVDLTVYDFALPDSPSAKTMVYYSMDNIHERYLGKKYPSPEDRDAARELRDRHFRLAHAHRIALIDDNCPDAPRDRPCDEWKERIAQNGVFAIAPYGRWGWRDKKSARETSDAWVTWFKKHAPSVDYFLYLADEPKDAAETEKLARLVKGNPGVGGQLPLFATMEAAKAAPSLDIVGSTKFGAPKGKRFWMYNAERPATGTFAIEDDGVALWQLAWWQYKMKVERWFYWESTYYDDFQSGMGKTDLFSSARTFGKVTKTDPKLGKTGWNYANGEGVLFYPGTDRLFPKSSYGAPYPFASWRLKEWRRGLQDVDYLTLAAKKDPAKVAVLVDKMVTWPTDPERWHEAREALAAIVAAKKGSGAPRL